MTQEILMSNTVSRLVHNTQRNSLSTEVRALFAHPYILLDKRFHT